VHLLDWPVLPKLPGDVPTATNWDDIRRLRAQVTEAIEPFRRDKVIKSSLEAEVTVSELPADAGALAETFIVAKVSKGDLSVARTDFHKCGRCWRHLPEVVADGELCDRCAEVVK
jgi:isoleucyl-tRNA synthetase